MSSDEPPIEVDALADYCETQAGLLLGTAETIASELDELLAEIDEETAAVRERLASGAAESEAVEMLEEKQTIAEAKQTRMGAFRKLAADYSALAETLRAEYDEGQGALDRVAQFEADRDAPAYFEDRQTVLEAAVADEDASENADGEPIDRN